MAKKIALCVGQNEYGPETGVTPLRGCVNDTLLIGELLRKAGFEVRQVHDQAATQRGILDRLSTEIAGLRSDDHFVFWNSSHGYQLRDRSGDELLDHNDEAICTYDTDPRDPLTDDKFASILSRANPEAVVFIGSDSCHSGSLTRAVGSDDRRARVWVPPTDIRSRTGRAVVALDDYLSGTGAPEPQARDLRRFGRGRVDARDEEMRHLLLAGCAAEQVSWDAKFPQGFHGAMTYHFAMTVLEAWKSGKAISYADAHRGASDRIAVEEGFGQPDTGEPQAPQLEGAPRLRDLPVFGYTP